MSSQRIGVHCLIELSGCAVAVLDDVDACTAALRQAAAAGGLEVLHLVTHKFEPQGVTAFALLSESHLAIHTWPEHASVAADLFTCGDAEAIPAVIEILRQAFNATHLQHREVERLVQVTSIEK